MKRSNKGGSPGTQNYKQRGGGTYRGRGRGYTRGGGAGRGQQGRGEDSSKYNTPGRDKGRFKCFNCNGYGHFAADCRKQRRQREREKEQTQEANLTQTEDEEPTLLFTECREKEPNVVLLSEGGLVPSLNADGKRSADSNLWYLDNGASNHMTGSKSKFKELDESVTGEVKFGDGSTVKIEGKGPIAVKCKNSEEWLLPEVYYIPSLRNNIISLGQLSENGKRVVLLGEYLWVYDENERPLMKVKRSSNRLYRIIVEDTPATCFLSKIEEDSLLWHSRLGHVNFGAMKLMSTRSMAHGIPEFTQQKGVCSGCLLSKQARAPFPSQANFAAKVKLELIHGDLCGPISPPTPAGNRYFLLLVDDYSRRMWVYMLKYKSEALEAFKKFKVMVENETKLAIKVLRTDRGGEFTSSEFQSFCDGAGILRHLTAPYSPQQNGVV